MSSSNNHTADCDASQRTARTALLLGHDGVAALNRSRVIIFGVGGVGSWCAEALARAGVGTLTIVDSDTVAASNINRQLVADCNTIGRLKVDVMAHRIHAVNPDCRIHAIAGVYNADTADSFRLDDYDVVVDAIDSLQSKAHLIITATRCRHARLVSSMGAALKTDITQIARAEFYQVKGCPLARALRDLFKRRGIRPARKFVCVYSPQLVPNRADTQPDSTPNGMKRVNGTLVTTTATFGLVLAQMAIQQITGARL